MKSVAAKFWDAEGWRITMELKPFITMVNDTFWQIVVTQALKQYHGSVAAFLDEGVQGECIHDGNDIGNIAMAAGTMSATAYQQFLRSQIPILVPAPSASACVTEKSEESGVAHAEQDDDLKAEREVERDHNLKKKKGLRGFDRH